MFNATLWQCIEKAQMKIHALTRVKWDESTCSEYINVCRKGEKKKIYYNFSLIAVIYVTKLLCSFCTIAPPYRQFV